MNKATPILKPGEFLKAVPIKKVDEKERQAWGVFTAEVLDCDNEIADYASQKQQVQKWSDDCKAKSNAAGQEESLGNVRFSHTSQPVGKVIKLHMDDANKKIGGGTYIHDDNAWQMTLKGILQGFSFGGRYLWRKCEECGRDMNLVQGDNFCDTCGSMVPVRFAASIAELSVCDRPAVPVANILHIKADGSRVELPTEAQLEKEAKTKRVAGEDLTAACFAYVGDAEDTSTWKLPIKFSTDEKTKSHIRNALARFSQTKGIPDDKKAEVKAKLIAAAKEHGIEVDDEDEKADAKGTNLFRKTLLNDLKTKVSAAMSAKHADFKKDLYDVGSMAQLLQHIAYLRYSALQEREYEGDDSELPEMLERNLLDITETFLYAAREETSELIAASERAGKVETVKTEAEKAAEAALAAAAAAATSNKDNTVTPEMEAALTGHLSEMQAHHEAAAEHHKAAGESHDQMCATCKTAHDHFNKAAEDGGEHDDHHAMTAKVHKADMEHHGEMSNFHKARASEHEEMAAHCGKMAEAFADTPEKKTAFVTALKTAREKSKKLAKKGPAAAAVAGSAIVPGEGMDLSKMSPVAKEAYERIAGEYYNSDEFKNIVVAGLHKKSVEEAEGLAQVSAGVSQTASTKGDGVFAVTRTGQEYRGGDGGETVEAEELGLSYIK